MDGGIMAAGCMYASCESGWMHASVHKIVAAASHMPTYSKQARPTFRPGPSTPATPHAPWVCVKCHLLCGVGHAACVAIIPVRGGRSIQYIIKKEVAKEGQSSAFRTKLLAIGCARTR